MRRFSFEKNEERSVSQSTNLAELGSKLHGDSTLKITTGNSGWVVTKMPPKSTEIRIVCPSTAKVTDEKHRKKNWKTVIFHSF